MKKIIKAILVLALIAFVVMQFIRPEKNNGGYESVMIFEKETKPSIETASILKETCYDCHSDQTRYPWYAEIAPVSYWLDEHIQNGKKHFNVSEWDNYSPKRKNHKLEELIEMIENKEMPLDSYTWIHDDLTEEERAQLVQWATLSKLQYRGRSHISFK
ncbi:heme-binding domain-containing protein [Jejudonia soesokkakensis]|uniref:Heme-binding domain-containing protein n=1 Tax=Jejudonia soesokkakensis TaxID=1323432 RepID=A0ABW2MS99_9FLAO